MNSLQSQDLSTYPNISIRQERASDRAIVFELTRDAFEDMPKSNNDEHNLVDRLRRSPAFIPELSLVAIVDEKLVGHILITKVFIKNKLNEKFPSLTLAPVSVLTAHQKKGIGSALINKAHQIALDLGYGSIVLLGHADYYPRFGYMTCAEFDIVLPFDSPAENCMIIELIENSLDQVSGIVEYPDAFFS